MVLKRTDPIIPVVCAPEADGRSLSDKVHGGALNIGPGCKHALHRCAAAAAFHATHVEQHQRYSLCLRVVFFAVLPLPVSPSDIRLRGNCLRLGCMQHGEAAHGMRMMFA